MFRGLIGLFGAAAERRLHNLRLGVMAAMAVALFSFVSLSFGTFAGYAYLRSSEGPVVAALIVCAAYALLAITFWLAWITCRHTGQVQRGAAAPAPASPGNVESLLRSLVAAGPQQDQTMLAEAMRLGRELSPMQLLALALIGGFIAGRKLGK